MRMIIRSISILTVVLAIAWFAYQPGFEPAITALAGIGGLLGTIRKSGLVSPTKEEQKRRRKTILYADDDLVRTRFHMLEDSGYKVVPAENADKTLREISSKKFDVILLDVMMAPPRFLAKEIVRDGYETGIYIARRIKESLNKETPIIVVTANPLREVETELRRIGVIGYLKKPFLQQDLEEEIEKALATNGN